MKIVPNTMVWLLHVFVFITYDYSKNMKTKNTSMLNKKNEI